MWVVDNEQAASQLDVRLDLEVVGITCIEWISHAVFVSCEARAGLQQPKYLAIDAQLVRCAASRLDGVDGVKRLVRSIDLQEVAVAGTRRDGSNPPLRLVSGRVPVDSRCCLRRLFLRRNKRAISINGPPTPQPMSATTIPGFSPSACDKITLVARKRRLEALSGDARRKVK